MFTVTFSEKRECFLEKASKAHIWKLSSWKWKITMLIRRRAWPLNTERVILEVVLSEQSQHTELWWVPGNNHLILQAVRLVQPGLFWSPVLFSYPPKTITFPKALYNLLLTSACFFSYHLSEGLPDKGHVLSCVTHGEWPYHCWWAYTSALPQ